MPMEIQIAPALTGALVGASATLIAGYGVYFRKQRDKRERLRTALIQEIESMEDPIEGYSQAIKQMNGIPETDFINTTIYESNVDKIGLLSEEEVDKITAFYTQAANTSEKIEFLNGHDEPGKTPTYVAMKDSGIEDLKQKNKDALEILEEKQK